MSALMIALVKIKDAAKMQQYSAAAAPTIIAAGGEILGRGKHVEALAGSLDLSAALIARFPSAAAAHAWYHAPAYQALIPLRDEAMVPTFFVLEEPA
ncbi:MAG: DUF1330 domain-containing protein [Xanthomonadaceae bacterium]|nr:DUF1330 domain-containing protein [Xanthomonadaceae bacterium]